MIEVKNVTPAGAGGDSQRDNVFKKCIWNAVILGFIFGIMLTVTLFYIF